MSQRRDSMWKVGVTARVMVLVAVLGSSWALSNGARAEDQLQKARADAGRIWYDQYCTPCHGKGGAPGTAVYPDSKKPIDLRQYRPTSWRHISGRRLANRGIRSAAWPHPSHQHLAENPYTASDVVRSRRCGGTRHRRVNC